MTAMTHLRLPFALAAFAALFTTACGPVDEPPPAVDLERLELQLPGDDGAPRFRVEAAFVGAERAAEVQALLDAIEVVPVDLPADAPPAAARAQHAIDRLSSEGGDAIVVRVHALREADIDRDFGYTVHLIEQEVAPEDGMHDDTRAAFEWTYTIGGSDGAVVGERRDALSLARGAARMHDLWCYGFQARYRVRQGSAVFSVHGPFGGIPLVTPPLGRWGGINLFAPAPWPSPWILYVINTGPGRLYYDASVTCTL